MENQKKYLDKFYKRNMTIDQIKNTYDVQRFSPPPQQQSPAVSPPPPSKFYMRPKELLFLWLFSCGFLFQMHYWICGA